MHPLEMRLVAALLLASFILGPTSLPAANEASRDTLVRVVTPQGTTIVAEVADTTEKRARGLMFLESLPRNRGMLFTFADAQPWTFWMKNTRIPLDIIWMDRDKRIVHIEKNVPGCTRQDDGCPQYQPNEDALYVLELAAGQAEALGLHRGTRLQFDLSRSARPETSPGPSQRGSGQSPGHR